jgi:formate hydrogenlyase transcriptional activator
MSRKPQELDLPRLKRYESLLDALESLTRHDDLTELFHELAQRLRKVLEFDFISVMLHDAAEGVMRLHILESEQPMNIGSGPILPPSETPGGWVWQSQEPLIISDYEAETRFPKLTPTWREYGMKSGYYLPLTTPQRRLGSINFASARPRTYDKCDMALFSRTARLVAVAVDNALNFESSQSYQRQLSAERDRLRLLLEINNAVVTQLDFRQLFKQIAASLRRFLQQDYLSLALFDRERQTFRIHALDFPAGKGLMQEEMIVPFQQAPAARALQTGRPVVSGRTDLERLNVTVARTLLAEGIQSHCAVPMVSRD